QAARSILARTRIHPTISFLEQNGIHVESCDDLYDDAQNFEDAYSQIVERVLAHAEQQGAVLFAVPGHPLFGERAVRMLQERASLINIPVRVVPSPGFLDVLLPAVNLDINDGVAVLDALNPSLPSAGVPAVYYQVYDRMIASNLKLTLLEQFGPETIIWHVQAAGTEGEKVAQVPLYQLDRLPYDHLTSVVLPAQTGRSISDAPTHSQLDPGWDTDTRVDGPMAGVIDESGASGQEPASDDFYRLVGLMEILRGPNGCPWDREQNLRTMRRYVLEEAYEVVDCIDRDDLGHLPEELGDLLLQVVFQAQIAVENGWFEVGDVIETICDKLIRRHPHVFGDVQAEDSDTVLRNWEAIKKVEREGASAAGTNQSEKPVLSALSGVPVGLPAVSRSYQIFKKAAVVGFDWPDVDGPLDKVGEELTEIREALAGGDRNAVAAEVGDLFLAAVNAARKLKLDPEEVTREALLRFIRRFEGVERLALQRGLSLPTMNLEEMDELWEVVKNSGLTLP
ncbi:MAG: nucleoside triphosphate pyrophosphohydrolase, partial [Armatimonadota bacterium]|nr:nucleoside triphosphate pyrophosphohydrolase [Armatimonadota bacterium]